MAGERLPATEANAYSSNRAVSEYARSFGIYRPISEDSARHIGRAVIGAYKLLGVGTGQRPGVFNMARLVPQSMGVTFVARGDVQYVFERDQMRRYFRTDEFYRLFLDNPALTDESNLSVRLGSSYAWWGVDASKCTAALDLRNDRRAAEVLSSQYVAISELLGKVGLGRVQVGVPDHVTVSKYDTAEARTDVTDAFKQELLEAVDVSFSAEGIESVELGSIVVGTSYAVPTPEFTDHLRRFVPQPRIVSE